jgi:hypothetical protein
MSPKTDKELLRLLGMAEQSASLLIRKSRQTLNIGLSRTDIYFRSDELARILAFVIVNDALHTKVVVDYIRQTRGEADATDAIEMAELLAARNNFLSSEDINLADEVWITLPDFRYFKTTYLDALKTIAERARRDLKSFKLAVGVQSDATLFFEFANIDQKKAEGSTIIAGVVDAWPYTLLLNPQGDAASGWVRVKGGFQMIDAMRTEGMLAALGHHIKRQIVTPASQTHSNAATTVGGDARMQFEVLEAGGAEVTNETETAD